MTLEFNNNLGSPTNFGVGALFQWAREGELILDPPFQRGSVWSTEQQEAWILSVLGGLPLPAIFVNKPSAFRTEWGTKMVVIDGRQRLEAMIAFEDNKLLVNGEKFSEQSVRFNRKWGFLAMPTVFTNFETKRECIELYVRLLTTGTAHTEKEIEKAKAMLGNEVTKKKKVGTNTHLTPTQRKVLEDLRAMRSSRTWDRVHRTTKMALVRRKLVATDFGGNVKPTDLALRLLDGK